MSDSRSEPVRLADYDYELPPERIAQHPLEPRDSSRLLVVPRGAASGIAHRHFRDLPDLLVEGDLLVANETRVSALRLLGKRSSGGAVELLLLRPAIEFGNDAYEALVKPGRKIAVGDRLFFDAGGLTAVVQERTTSGGRIVRFESSGGGDVADRLEAAGRVPLPPYITAPLADSGRYQTVYAKTPGSAAAPTAGLHFTPELLRRVEEAGVGIAKVRLDVGLGTFRPIRVDDVTKHEMHSEAFSVSAETADAVNNCRGRVLAVGTTSLRALESAALSEPRPGMRISAVDDTETSIFIYPGYAFRAVDGLITNFHQPHSTLLLLVAAFVGGDQMRRAYTTALGEQYRFLSFGDAMIAL